MFALNLVTPEKKIATELEVDEVIVPAERGQLTFLPGHAPLITTLQLGLLKYKAKGQSQWESVVVSWGYCEVNPNGVTVLAETAETIEEIDRERAEASVKRAQKKLAEPNLEPNQITKYQRKLKRALARIEYTKNSTTH
jgi:F-type H+-transporting ATPase subunit epsilon